MYDDFSKVCKVFDSCKTMYQYNVAQKMFLYYKRKHNGGRGYQATLEYLESKDNLTFYRVWRNPKA